VGLPIDLKWRRISRRSWLRGLPVASAMFVLLMQTWSSYQNIDAATLAMSMFWSSSGPSGSELLSRLTPSLSFALIPNIAGSVVSHSRAFSRVASDLARFPALILSNIAVMHALSDQNRKAQTPVIVGQNFLVAVFYPIGYLLNIGRGGPFRMLDRIHSDAAGEAGGVLFRN
jgi:hypothetical protein